MTSEQTPPELAAVYDTGFVDTNPARWRADVSKSRIADLGSGTVGWCLQLSNREIEYLEQMNPGTLGAVHDPALCKAEWAKFVQDPASQPYKVLVALPLPPQWPEQKQWPVR
jgi:hypothetical protein